MQLGNHIQTQDVRLALFHARRHIKQRLTHGATTIDRILDTEAMCHFVEHCIRKESIERYVFALRLINKHICYRLQNFVELGLHGVL